MQKHVSFQRLGLVTGIGLLLGFFLPIIIDLDEGEMFFPNILFLVNELFPFSVKLYLLLPLLGGIACLVALVPSNAYIRAGLYFFAGFAPWLLEYFMTAELLSYSSGMGMNFMSGSMFPSSSTIMGFLLRFGLVGMLAAAFAGRAIPQNKFAPYVAIVGSVMVLLAMVFPVQSADGHWSILLAIPFETLGSNAVFSALILILFALLMAAAFLGILWGIGHKKGVQNARSMKLILLITLVYMILAIFFFLFLQFADNGRFSIGTVELSVGYLKVLGMFLAPFLAKCLGLMELLAVSRVGEGNEAVEIKTSPNFAEDGIGQGAELPFEGKE
jgi:hypothetical protein